MTDSVPTPDVLEAHDTTPAPDDATLWPLRNVVLIRPEDPTLRSAAGLWLPDSASEDKPFAGTVLAHGPGILSGSVFVPTVVREGDRVIFNRHGPVEVEVEGETLLMMQESVILAIVGVDAGIRVAGRVRTFEVPEPILKGFRNPRTGKRVDTLGG